MDAVEAVVDLQMLDLADITLRFDVRAFAHT